MGTEPYAEIWKESQASFRRVWRILALLVVASLGLVRLLV